MELGELLKKLRVERNMSQRELSQGLLERSALSRVENGTSNISAETLLLLLGRLNVTAVEFFADLDLAEYKQKRDYGRILLNSMRNEADYEKFQQDVRQKYEATNDFYYFMLAVNSELVYAKKHFLSFDHFEKDIQIIKNYLDSVETWTSWELMTYTNIMYVFDNRYIENVHDYVLWGIERLPYKQSQRNVYRLNYANNALVLAVERGHYDYFERYLRALENSVNNATDIYARMMIKFFENIYAYVHHGQQAQHMAEIQEVIQLFKAYDFQDEVDELEYLLTKI
ncbi:MAG TPA: helix-turn-helix domain-containing protein [Lactobacillaceae bacterium]|jgi:Rgg/GadR/MutR family transcriptional activator